MLIPLAESPPRLPCRLNPIMLRLRIACALALAAVCGLATRVCAEEPAVDRAASVANFQTDLAPLVQKYCAACHSGEEPTSGSRLDEVVARADAAADRETWEAIAQKLHDQEMPPEDEPLPSASERKQLTDWIDGQLALDTCGDVRDPGRVTLRRLNRNEYNNTIRDLLGVDFQPAEEFPTDDVGYGFDNIGDVLTMPPILLEKYLDAAEEIVHRALGTHQRNLVTGEITGGQPFDGGVRVLAGGNERIQSKVRLFGTGKYIVRVRAWGDQAGDEPVRMAVYLDKRLVRRFDVRAVKDQPLLYEGWIDTRGGSRTVSIEFENDFYQPNATPPGDRNLWVQSIEVSGSYPATMSKIIPREHTPEDRMLLAREAIGDVMRRAFRRPVKPEEIQRVMQLVEMADRNGENLHAAIGLGLQAILVSPHFLFRIEQDPEPGDEDGIRTLDDFELATRLSYFLWSSMPDDELMTYARLGKLRSDDNLERQVRRMLADPKSQALVRNFGNQWLQLRNLANFAPDREKFPDFDEPLRTAMREETERFFAAIMREDRSVLEFIDADYTFVNERLAKHYGIADVKGEEFRKVSLDPAQRGGVLTQASVLAVTSNPTRTSPVKRGKWVLENLFGTPPPPPPPDVPELAEGDAALTGTLRERTEQHRAKAACAVCHNRMDPLGFGLENYDAIGAWRTKDGPHDIDASGELPGGKTFAGPQQLKLVLRERQDEFVRCLSEKMLTYALGRGVEYSDRCTVQDLAAALQTNDYKFSSLILAIVASDAFQKRRGPPQPHEGSEP